MPTPPSEGLPSISSPQLSTKSTKSLTFLYINDLHSRYENFSRLATAIRSIRANTPNLLIVDTGDNADFMRMEVEGTQGEISSALLNDIGCNFRVIGNNEGFSGLSNIRRMQETFKGDFLTSNLYDFKTKEQIIIPSAVVRTIAGVRILFIGLTGPYNTFYHLYDLHVKDPMEEFGRVVAEYPPTDYDLLVVLSHLGIDSDTALAQQFPVIDIVIGAHSHTLLHPPRVVDDTIIVQAGEFGNHCGVLTVKWNPTTHEITNHTHDLISSAEYSPDPSCEQILAKYHDRAVAFLETPLFELPGALNHSFSEENALTNLLADALLTVFPADFAFINSGILEKSLEPGPVSQMALLEVSPSPLNPTRVEILGHQLLKALENSLQASYQQLELKGDGFRGRYLGNLAVSANVQVRYSSDLTSSESSTSHMIREVAINGQPIDPDRMYVVVTSDHLQRGNGYTCLKSVKRVQYDPRFMRHLLADAIPTFMTTPFTPRFLID